MRLHRASGQARVRLRDSETGAVREIYLGPFGSRAARDRYHETLGAWLAGGRRLTPSGSASRLRTLADLMAAHLDYARATFVKRGRPTSTYYSARRIAQLLLADERRASLPPSAFGPCALRAFAEELGSMRRPDGAPIYTRTTVNGMTQSLRGVFRWAAGSQLIEPAIAEALRLAAPLRRGRPVGKAGVTPRERTPVGPVGVDDVEAALAHCRPAIAAMARLQLATAMRPLEVCMMRPGLIAQVRGRANV